MILLLCVTAGHSVEQLYPGNRAATTKGPLLFYKFILLLYYLNRMGETIFIQSIEKLKAPMVAMDSVFLFRDRAIVRHFRTEVRESKLRLFSKWIQKAAKPERPTPLPDYLYCHYMDKVRISIIYNF